MRLEARKRGSILIMSLWASSILSILLASLAFQAGIQRQLVTAERNQFEGHWALISGLNLASEALAADPEPYQDSPLDGWYGDLVLEDSWKDRVAVHVEDEEAKLNLNLANEKLLTGFFGFLKKEGGNEFQSDVKAMVKGIMKWRSEKKNRRFDFLEELLLIDEIGEKDFEAFKSYVTVSGDEVAFPRVNINTASKIVLGAIIASVPGDEFRKKELLEKILEMREDARAGTWVSQDASLFCFREEELHPHLFMEKLKLPSTIQMTGLVNQLLPHLTTDSKTFRVEIKAPQEGKRAEAVILASGAEIQPVILSWHEE